MTAGSSAAVEISAHTVYGAMHALESLLHLAEEQPSGKRVIRGCPWDIDGARALVRRLPRQGAAIFFFFLLCCC